MKKNNTVLNILIIALFFSGFMPAAQTNEEKKQKEPYKLGKINTNDHYEFISVNEVKMWISNNGDNSHEPITSGSGLLWPGGPQATLSLIFEDGLVFGGKVNGVVRVGGSTYRHGLQAGKILDNGLADDPNLDKYRIYKIRKDWENLDPTEDLNDNGVPDISEYETDYNEWPVEDGAPWVDMNGDGLFTRGIDTPEFVGDEVLWYVSNDLDELRTTFLYDSQPIGIEVQNTTFAFKENSEMDDIVFQKYLLINKGSNSIEDMYVGFWSDPDIGNPADDFSGCDSILGLAYTYNADNNDDDKHGENPPAIGYDFIQGPIILGESDDQARFRGEIRNGFKNLSMSGFIIFLNGSALYRDPPLGSLDGTSFMYYYMESGRGTPYIDPHTGTEVNYILAGDPVGGSGWYEGEGWPEGEPDGGDRRHLMSSGPFTMAPGDTQEVVIGIIIAQGSDNLQSVNELKNKSIVTQEYWDNLIYTAINYDKNSIVPTKFELSQNYPNPFNPKTIIEYSIPKQSNVTIKVFDVLGSEVSTLVNKEQPQGNYEVEFTGGDLTSGIYFYRLQAGDFVETKKMLLLK